MLTKDDILKMLLDMMHPNDGSEYANTHLDLLYNKYTLTHRLQPKGICEIGVRCGYSMRMFMAATGVPCKVMCIDNAGDEHGGFLGAIGWAIDHLPHIRLSFHIADSQMLYNYDIPGRYEFWHIDGDHTKGGTYHDLTLAFMSDAKYMLVDDYGRIPETREGTDWFLDVLRVPYVKHEVDEFQLLITIEREKDGQKRI